MPSLQEALKPILSKPAPSALVTLQGILLAWPKQDQGVEHALEVASRFHSYLAELQAKLTAKQYSELASMLDIGAVGLVVLENIITADEGDYWQGLIMGGFAEGLMVAASRQYVKAWQAETRLVYAEAAWYLTQALWHTSREMVPDLDAGQRWQAIQGLLAPAYEADVPPMDKALLLGRVFQFLLITRLAPLLSSSG